MRILFLALLTGCSLKIEQSPSTYRCTKEQMERVQTETLFCIKNFINHISENKECFDDSMVRNCLSPKEVARVD